MINRRQFIVGAAAGAVFGPQLVLAKTGDGVFDLRAVSRSTPLAGERFPVSDLWLYNGETPGPEIRVKQGERVRVRFVNELDEPTSVHWHGIRIDNAMDGVSGLTQEPVSPGGMFEYDFVVPDAGTFWYHAHNKSWSHVARGLYGPLIVEESDLVFDRSHDVTLVIDDWRLDDNGVLDVASIGSFMDWSHAGRLGNWVTVDGRSQPRLEFATGELYRIRLINAANARIFHIDPTALGVKILALDGFPLPKTRKPSGGVALAPAQRIDLLFGSTEPTEISLNDIGDFALQELSGTEPVSLAKLVVVGTERQLPKEPARLPLNRIREPDLTSPLKVPLVMTGGAMGNMGDMTYQGIPLDRETMMSSQQVWAFNGVANMSIEPLFAAKSGQTVQIETVNGTGWAHSMHVHGHHFRVLSINGAVQDNQVWRDTFLIERDETVAIAFVADNPGRWMLHCHMLEHAAAGMRTWFSVT